MQPCTICGKYHPIIRLSEITYSLAGKTYIEYACPLCQAVIIYNYHQPYEKYSH